MKQQQLLELEFLKNSGSGDGSGPLLPGTDLVRNKKHVFIGVYDFAVLGGAVGTINLKDTNGAPAQLPKGAVITFGLIDVITTITSGGSATIAFGTGASTTDLKAATAIASITGRTALIPVGSAATAVKLTADNVMNITIATAALTAGKFNVLVEYYLSA